MAWSLTPSEPMLLAQEHAVVVEQHRLDEAETQFLSAAKQPFYKTPKIAYANAALCAREKPDPVKAEEYLRMALRLDPRMAQALYARAGRGGDQHEYLSSAIAYK